MLSFLQIRDFAIVEALDLEFSNGATRQYERLMRGSGSNGAVLIVPMLDNETGLLVPEKDSNALANALEKLIQSPQLRKKLGEQGRDKVLESFNLKKSTKQLFKLIQETEELEPNSLLSKHQMEVR